MTLERRLLHTREVLCQGYRRADGLYDIEGRMRDLSAEATSMIFHDLPPGGAIHDMRLVLTIDEQLLIHGAQAFMDATATPFCGPAAQVYGRLVGLTIGPGFRQAAKARVGGVSGCTHLTELLGPMGTAAMQTIFAELREAKQRRGGKLPDGPLARPAVIDTCHAYRIDSPATAVLWPPERRGNGSIC